MTRLALLALALSTIALGACHDHTNGVGREPDEYVGCATDENWATFDDVAEVVSDSEAPQITAPTSTTLANTPVDFTWRQSAALAGSNAGDVAATCPQFNAGFTTLHLPPVSGTAYDVQISSGGSVKHRVITTLQKWTASSDVWSQLAGSTIEVRIRRMVLLNNDRKEGPYASSTPFTGSVVSK